jgi:hypothetical protein
LVGGSTGGGRLDADICVMYLEVGGGVPRRANYFRGNSKVPVNGTWGVYVENVFGVRSACGAVQWWWVAAEW